MAGSFADVWNPTYEGLPSDNEAINLGANRIRDFKVNTRERIAIDHSFAGDVNDGKHIQSTYRVATADPTLDATDGAVYAKAVSGNTELFYKDSSGAVTQLTSAGHLSPFPSGTFMLFMQSAPPSGWTQYASVNDAMIRVVSGGGGGGTGGSWTISGASVSTAVTTTTSVSITGINMSLTLNPISLSIPNLPLHVHSLSQVQITSTPGSGSPSFYPAQLNTGAALGQGPATDATGSGATFTPTGSIGFNSGSATASSSSPATSSFSNDGTWRPAYVNVIAATKN